MLLGDRALVPNRLGRHRHRLRLWPFGRTAPGHEIVAAQEPPDPGPAVSAPPPTAAGARRAGAMTIGRLSRQTGVSVKTLRTYEDLGLIYTVGRSEGNYRLFGDEALWCVAVVGALRDLGLTLAEIQQLTEAYLARPGQPHGPRLGAVLAEVRARTEAQMAQLRARLERIADFERRYAEELAGRADFRAQDPLFGPGGA